MNRLDGDSRKSCGNCYSFLYCDSAGMRVGDFPIGQCCNRDAELCGMVMSIMRKPCDKHCTVKIIKSEL